MNLGHFLWWVSQVLEDSEKNHLAQAFFSYFPLETKVITVEQAEDNTEMSFIKL